MLDETLPNQILQYDTLLESIELLELPFTPSELHGLMCGFLCAGKTTQGEQYIQSLFQKEEPSDQLQEACLGIMTLYAYSLGQLLNFDLSFQLVIPMDDISLNVRAEAFSEWCNYFIQGTQLAQIALKNLEEEEQEALQHIAEFSKLDFKNLETTNADEKAFFEVTDYTRMAVLRISYSLTEAQQMH